MAATPKRVSILAKVRFPVAPLLAVLLVAGLLVAVGCGGSSEGSAAGSPGGSGDPGTPADGSGGSPDPLQDGLESDSNEPVGSASFESAPPATSPEPGFVEDTAGPAADVPDASGEWSGTVSSEAGEEGRLQLSLSQQPDATLSGSMVWTIAGEEPVAFEGLAGRVYPDGQVELLWQHPVSEDEGELSLVGQMSAGQSEDQLSGEVTFVSDVSGNADGVTFAVTRLPE